MCGLVGLFCTLFSVGTLLSMETLIWRFIKLFWNNPWFMIRWSGRRFLMKLRIWLKICWGNSPFKDTTSKIVYNMFGLKNKGLCWNIPEGKKRNPWLINWRILISRINSKKRWDCLLCLNKTWKSKRTLYWRFSGNSIKIMTGWFLWKNWARPVKEIRFQWT